MSETKLFDDIKEEDIPDIPRDGISPYTISIIDALEKSQLNYDLSTLNEDERKTTIMTWYQRIADYLQHTILYRQKIGNQAMYHYMGLSKNQIEAMIDKKPPWTTEHQALATKIKTICAVAREQYMIHGEINVNVGVFHQKNYDGLQDIQIQKTEHIERLTDEKSLEELDQIYLLDTKVK